MCFSLTSPVFSLSLDLLSRKQQLLGIPIPAFDLYSSTESDSPITCALSWGTNKEITAHTKSEKKDDSMHGTSIYFNLMNTC